MKTSRFIVLYLMVLISTSFIYAQNVSVGKYIFQKNGSTYYGELKGGKPDGKGKTTFITGDTYEGEYVKGMRQGYGVYTFTDGEKYEGNWYQDHQHGKGVYYFVNNEWEKYDGMWYLDYMQGDGTMYYTNGDIYIGEWLQDKRNGQGKYIYSNGEIYSGTWENDILIHSSIQNNVNITKKKDKTNIAEKGTRNLQPNDNQDPDKRTIPVTVSVIDTLEAERLFQPIKDSLLAISLIKINKQKRIQELLEPSPQQKKNKEKRKTNENTDIYHTSSSVSQKQETNDFYYSPTRKQVETSEDLALLSEAYYYYPYKEDKIQKDVWKGKLTIKVVDCLNIYHRYLSEGIQTILSDVELGWRKCLPQAGVAFPRKEIIEMVNNPNYRGYHYRVADTMDMLERYQQRKGWEFLYEGTRIYKEDTYPIKFNYYIYNDAPQYKVDDNDLTVYNTNGQLVYVPSLTRKNTPVFVEIHRLVYFADYKKNKYNILSESEHTQKFLNRTLGEKGGIEKSAYLGAGVALVLAFSASPYAYFTGNSLSPQQRGQMIDEFQKDYRDTAGENFINQLAKDHENEFGYIYMIERVSDVSFRVIYINSRNLKPSYCALITYRTGTKPFTKDFSVKLINVPTNIPPIPIEE